MTTYIWFAVTLICCSKTSGATGKVHIVNVVDVTKDVEAMAPLKMEMVLHTQEGPLTLRLKRNPNVNMDFVTYSAENGVITQDAPSASNVALYTDQRNQASIAVTSVKHDSHKLYKRSVSGWFTMNGAEYTIEPEDDGDGNHAPKSKRFVGDDENHEDSRTVPHTITRREIKRIVNDYGAIPVKRPEGSPNPIVNDTHEPKAQRARKVAFGVELLLGIDYGLYKRWVGRVGQNEAFNAMKQYYALMINGVDMRYASIQDSEFSIFVRLAGIIFSKGENEVPWTDRYASPPSNSLRRTLGADAALERIRTFDNNPPYRLVQHDHLMVFTDHDMYAGNSGNLGVTGLAWTRATCTTSSQSIVEDHGGFVSIGVAAHELGHSLGAKDHDGEGVAGGCSGALQFVMTAISGSQTANTQPNTYLFSQCSIAQMKYYLLRENYGAKCLSANTHHYNDEEVQELIDTPPGQLYDVDDQCKQVYGPNSYYCDSPQNNQQICLYLWCFNPYQRQCYRYLGAAPGTTCGNQKWCSDGLCVYDESAPSVAGMSIRKRLPRH